MQVFLHSNKRIVFFGIIYGNIFFYLYFMKLQLLKKKRLIVSFRMFEKKCKKKLPLINTHITIPSKSWTLLFKKKEYYYYYYF